MQPAFSCDADPGSPAACQDARDIVVQERPAAARRKRLNIRTQRECETVKAAIADNDGVAQRTGARGLMESLQQDTLSLRKRYQELGC